MTQHLLLPGLSLEKRVLHPAYEHYLREWREEAIQRAENDDVAASICHQASLVDLVLFGKVLHDWVGIMDEFLMDDGSPLAYSETFGKRLHKFEHQYRQSTVHAIHTRWWIENLVNGSDVDHDRFADLILAKKQTDGLIYDCDVSETILRHRMKSELTMSMAMSAEILRASSKLSSNLAVELATNITSPTKCPVVGYMSMEYFRLKALNILGYEPLFPVGIEGHIEACAEGLCVGWCDFAMKSKVDAYMGTAKRTQRDKPIHSPLIACYVSALLSKIQDVTKKATVTGRLEDYACQLKSNPLNIPAFQMRDVPISFGDGITPIEIICASFLATQCKFN
jgi:hypothetical protein